MRELFYFALLCFLEMTGHIAFTREDEPDKWIWISMHTDHGGEFLNFHTYAAAYNWAKYKMEKPHADK